MKDLVKRFFIALYNEVLIDLNELKYLVNNRVFWAGTFLLFMIAILDGCMRRGV